MAFIVIFEQVSIFNSVWDIMHTFILLFNFTLVILIPDFSTFSLFDEEQAFSPRNIGLYPHP